MKQQSPQKEMIFGDTFNECLTVLAELGAIHPSVARANINALGIQPIRAEYSIILHEMSDTELARSSYPMPNSLGSLPLTANRRLRRTERSSLIQ